VKLQNRSTTTSLTYGCARCGATWERIEKLATFLPIPKTLHPWPQQLFAA
jgi:hypothetical protein